MELVYAYLPKEPGSMNLFATQQLPNQINDVSLDITLDKQNKRKQ